MQDLARWADGTYAMTGDAVADSDDPHDAPPPTLQE
jgi:endogenous inhibitor of DNA gyrase (YacG/DUF329 family)